MTGAGSEGGHSKDLREDYLGEGSLDRRASSWFDLLHDYIRHPFDRSRLGDNPALLVLDMQRFFLEKESRAFLPAALGILPKVNTLIGAFLLKGKSVVFTRHEDPRGEPRNPMARWWGKLLAPDDPMSALYPDLEGFRRETVLVKHHYSAFHETRLEALFLRLRASAVVITGVMTHLCCETTARDAFMRGFDVVVVVDGTATLNEELHLSSLRSLAQGFASPALAKEVQFGLGP